MNDDFVAAAICCSGFLALTVFFIFVVPPIIKRAYEQRLESLREEVDAKIAKNTLLKHEVDKLLADKVVIRHEGKVALAKVTKDLFDAKGDLAKMTASRDELHKKLQEHKRASEAEYARLRDEVATAETRACEVLYNRVEEAERKASESRKELCEYRDVLMAMADLVKSVGINGTMT